MLILRGWEVLMVEEVWILLEERYDVGGRSRSIGNISSFGHFVRDIQNNHKIF